jgi:hypothetical protein
MNDCLGQTLLALNILFEDIVNHNHFNWFYGIEVENYNSCWRGFRFLNFSSCNNPSVFQLNFTIYPQFCHLSPFQFVLFHFFHVNFTSSIFWNTNVIGYLFIIRMDKKWYNCDAFVFEILIFWRIWVEWVVYLFLVNVFINIFGEIACDLRILWRVFNLF